MTLRDDLEPVVDLTRQIVEDLGFRPYIVKAIKRTWDGDEIGSGTPSDDELQITPSPKVGYPTPNMVYKAGGAIMEGDRLISKISRSYTQTQLDGGNLSDNQEFFWTINDELYRLVQQPQKKNLEWQCLLRKMSHDNLTP